MGTSETVSFKIGIDVGGTFTDLFLWSSHGAVESFKVLSTPHDPSVGVLDGLRTIAHTHHLTLEQMAHQVTTIVHGTTVTTNAVLTRGGARTGLITTDGVRDALEMGAASARSSTTIVCPTWCRWSRDTCGSACQGA